MYRSTKSFFHLPCAHRQWRSDGACKYIHGYDRSVHFIFESDVLDNKSWVMDFGGLKEISQWLEDKFDHTLLINEDDPELKFFEKLDKMGLCKLRTLPNIGMEGSAKYICDYVDSWVQNKTKGRVRVFSVECRENEKNSAIYYPREASK